MQSQNVVMVYVADDASEDETTQIGTSLKGISNVESCEFVPKEVAFQEQIQSMGGDAALFEGFDEIPLPDAYKVTVKDLSQFENTVSQIKQINKVDSVRENSDLASKLLSLRHAVSIVSVGLVIMLFLVALFIISNTIRITMFSRKLEISIMKAVGATNWFIRWPFNDRGYDTRYDFRHSIPGSSVGTLRSSRKSVRTDPLVNRLFARTVQRVLVADTSRICCNRIVYRRFRKSCFDG